MEKTIYLLGIFCICICVIACGNANSKAEQKHIYDKAVIYYAPNIAPWGLLKITDVSAQDFLKHRDNLCKIVLTNKDSILYISKTVNKTHPDSLIDNNYVDTSIAVLLFSQGNVDTLSSDAYPQSRIQYNRTFLYDSTLVYYFINIIRKQNSVWDNAAKDYYYNGINNSLPHSTFKNGLHRPLID